MLSEVCPPHRGYTWSHHPRSCATLQGRKAKAALRRIVKSAARVVRRSGCETKWERSLPGLRRYFTSCSRSMHLPYGHFRRLHPTPIGQETPKRGCSYRRVLCAGTAGESEGVLGRLGCGAKRRAAPGRGPQSAARGVIKAGARMPRPALASLPKVRGRAHHAQSPLCPRGPHPIRPGGTQPILALARAPKAPAAICK